MEEKGREGEANKGFLPQGEGKVLRRIDAPGFR